MDKQCSSQISLTTLILCLCLGSLVLAMNVFGLSVMEISGVDSENYNLFDQAEFDEEFFIVTIVNPTVADLISTKSRPANLDFQTACILPIFPPPKHS